MCPVENLYCIYKKKKNCIYMAHIYALQHVLCPLQLLLPQQTLKHFGFPESIEVKVICSMRTYYVCSCFSSNNIPGFFLSLKLFFHCFNWCILFFFLLQLTWLSQRNRAPCSWNMLQKEWGFFKRVLFVLVLLLCNWSFSFSDTFIHYFVWRVKCTLFSCTI